MVGASGASRSHGDARLAARTALRFHVPDVAARVPRACTFGAATHNPCNRNSSGGNDRHRTPQTRPATHAHAAASAERRPWLRGRHPSPPGGWRISREVTPRARMRLGVGLGSAVGTTQTVSSAEKCTHRSSLSSIAAAHAGRCVQARLPPFRARHDEAGHRASTIKRAVTDAVKNRIAGNSDAVSRRGSTS
jgi:hypothetical protein